MQAAIELSNVAEKVYLVARRNYVADPIVVDKMKQKENIVEVQGYESINIEGKDFVETFNIRHRETREQKSLYVQGVFVEAGLVSNSDFLDGSEKNQQGEIVVNCRMETKIPGLFAAGDVTDGPDKQIVIAAGDGSKAALGAFDYLLYRKDK